MLGYMVAGVEEIIGVHGHGFWDVCALLLLFLFTAFSFSISINKYVGLQKLYF